LTFKKILVPYDGSPMSDKALEKAVEISKLVEGSRITAIHVIQEISTPVFDRAIRSPRTGEVTSFAEYMATVYQEIRNTMQKGLDERKRNIEAQGISINVFITQGNPSDKIVDYVTNEKVDLVVIGSVGLTGVSKFFKGLGSVSRKVSERVSCPVLIVR
jgi:nucleotide-binding universal stress UspA family protein